MPDPSVLVLVLAFLIKHFIADFVLQTAWMVRTKGRYGHIGGLIHTGIHLVCSGLILAYFGFGFLIAALLLLGEGIIHYHVDWAKDQITSRRGYDPSSHMFWILTGLDQLIHYLTYLAMIALLVL
ncbi:MAG: DUF3307 domain-containing protein [Marivivens sp.]|nr:DUF3307 domain-containing protein [Marivivens sp.]